MTWVRWATFWHREVERPQGRRTFCGRNIPAGATQGKGPPSVMRCKICQGVPC